MTRMGTFRVPIEVGSVAEDRFERVTALVDTGATYSFLPREVLGRLGVQPEEEWPFVLADGREITYPVATVRVRIQGRARHTIAVFGAPGSDPLLGAFTLEAFRLAADPVNHRLVSVPALLKTA